MTIKIKNQKLASPKFWDSFTTLMEMKDLAVVDKLSLAKLKNQIMIEVDAAREVLKNATDEEDKQAVLDRENAFEFVPIKVPMENLTAEELFQLEGLYKEE